MGNIKRIGALILAATLSACGGGGSSSTIPSHPGGGGSGPSGTLAITITIPKKKVSAVRPYYVSASTQSMSISIAGPTPVNPPPVNFTPSSPNCTAGPNGLVCQTQVTQLQPGAYTGTITTYDNVNATGNVLSTAQTVPFTIKAGLTNAVLLTMSGVPHSITATPNSAVNTVTTGSNAYDLIGTPAHAFTVESLDADGNVIAGPGAPTFVIAQSGGSFGAVLTQPTKAAPNTVGVTPPATWPLGANASLTVTASFAGQGTDGCASPGAVCSLNLTVTPRELMAVSDGSGASAIVRIYDVTSGTPVFVKSLAMPNGTDVAKFDPNGNVFVGPNHLHGTNPAEFLGPALSSPGNTITSLGLLGDFAFLPDGSTMYADDQTKTGIQSYNIATGLLNNPIPVTPQGALAVSPDGAVLYDTDDINEIVQPVNTAHNGIQTPISLPAGCSPKAITVSPDSTRLFVSCFGNDTVAIIEAASGATQSVGSASGPFTLAYDPTTSDLCVPNAGSAMVELIHDNGDGSGTNVATLPVGTNPRAASVDASGNCYVVNFSSGSVSEVNTTAKTVTTPITGIGSPIYVNVLP